MRQAQSAKENLKVENQELKSINEQHLKKIEDLLRRIATLTNNLSMQMVRKNQETQTVQ